MKPLTLSRIAGVGAFLSVFLTPLALLAQSSTWTSIGSGSWNNPENWQGGVPASGVDAIATFAPAGASTLAVTNPLPDLTLGGIVVSPAATKPTTISGGNIVLQSSKGVPTITLPAANPAGLTISSTLSGTQGFTLASSGRPRLQISGNNRGLSGTITMDGGTLVVGENRALGSAKLVLNSGVLNGSAGRTIPNAVVWNGGVISMDTTSGAGASGSRFQIDGPVTLAAAEGTLVASSINVGNTQFFVFNGVVSSLGEGRLITLNNGNSGGNLYVALGAANTFAHQITIAQGGVPTSSGLGKSGSTGIFVGDNAALSVARINVQPGVSRFVLASTDATPRTLANGFVWQTHESNMGAQPAYEFTFGAYSPVGADFTTSLAIGTVGGGGDLVVGDFEVNANSGAGPVAYRRISVTGSTTATIKGVFSSSGTLGRAGVRVEKRGSGTLVLANDANTFGGAVSVAEGTLIIDGKLGGAGVSVSSGAAIGGDGTLEASLDLYAYAGLVFRPGAALTVNGAEVTLAGFSVGSLIGLDAKVAEGTYTLIDGSAKIDPSNVANLGESNAQDIGGGKAACLKIESGTGDLQLVVFKRRS